MNIAIFVIVTMYMLLGIVGAMGHRKAAGEDLQAKKTLAIIWVMMIPLFILSLIKLFIG